MRLVSKSVTLAEAARSVPAQGQLGTQEEAWQDRVDEAEPVSSALETY